MAQLVGGISGLLYNFTRWSVEETSNPNAFQIVVDDAGTSPTSAAGPRRASSRTRRPLMAGRTGQAHQHPPDTGPGSSDSVALAAARSDQPSFAACALASQAISVRTLGRAAMRPIQPFRVDQRRIRRRAERRADQVRDEVGDVGDREVAAQVLAVGQLGVELALDRGHAGARGPDLLRVALGLGLVEDLLDQRPHVREQDLVRRRFGLATARALGGVLRVEPRLGAAVLEILRG